MRNDNRKNEGYEVIVQIGDRKSTGHENTKKEQEIYKEYLKEFQERNNNLYIFGAYIHNDEETTHMHIDYIPFGKMKKGMEVQNSYKQAMYEMGFITAKGLGTAQEQWTRNEREEFERLCRDRGINIEHKKENREHLEKELYILRSQNEELEKENRKMLEKIYKKQKEYRDINKAEIKAVEPRKTISGKKIVDFEEYKATIDKMNAENYELKQEVIHWKERALAHADARERLEKGIKAENARYIEKDIEVEQLREILEKSQKPQTDYIDWKREHEQGIQHNDKEFTRER